MTDQKILSLDDVVWMETSKRNPCEHPTSTVKEVKSALCAKAVSEHWIYNGVDCSVLFTNENGWRKGKVKIRLEFIPEDELASEQEINVTPELPLPSEPSESNLDDLRKELNL